MEEAMSTTDGIDRNAAAPSRSAFARVRGPLLFNAVAPFATYEILTSRGVSELVALAVGALFPLAAIAVGAARTRRLDPFAAVTLAAIAVGLIGALVFASPRVLLVKDSVITATIGLVFLGSLAARRPLIFVLARQIAENTVARAALEQRWTLAQTRRRFRIITLVWGIALVGEAAIRVTLSFLVSPGVLLLLSPLLAVAVFGSIGLWTLRLRRAASNAQPGDQTPADRA
jgi:hypothetical protein